MQRTILVQAKIGPLNARALLLVIVFSAASCGPIQSIRKVSMGANRAVAEAKTINAEKWAPYEYHSATLYLQMAKEKEAYAEFELAIYYGEQAEKYAKEAVQKTTQILKSPTDEVPRDLLMRIKP